MMKTVLFFVHDRLKSLQKTHFQKVNQYLELSKQKTEANHFRGKIYLKNQLNLFCLPNYFVSSDDSH